jgi:phage/plasmid-like protein (TIGR03299 family)
MNGGTGRTPTPEGQDMTAEKLDDLRANTRIGFTAKRGNAWHYRVGDPDSARNHYDGAVPYSAVKELFGFDLVSAPLHVALPDDLVPTVEILPGQFVADPDGSMPVVPGKQAIIRSDTGAVLGIFAEGYAIHPYGEWLLANVSNILGDTLAIGSAGLLKGGAQAWVSVEVPENITTPEGVEFRPNLLACTSCDGSLATQYRRIVTNVVCDNTMAAGLSEIGQLLKIKHSRYSKLRINEARDALQMVHQVAENFEAEVKALCEVTVTEKQWSKFLDAHVPLIDPKTKADKSGKSLTMATNERAALTKMWNNDTRVSPWKNTAFGVVQAVNTYTHHEGLVRNVSRPERNMANAVTGKTETLDSTTFKTLMGVLA